MIKPSIGQKAPLFSVSEWVQGEPTNFNQLTGKVVLLEVFQVNCPGCFLYALPQAIDLHQRYSSEGLSVLGIATAFEDFDKNTLENLLRLVKTQEVIGETLYTLNQHGILIDGRLPFSIPFPLAMDYLVKSEIGVSEDKITAFIEKHIPDFGQKANTYQENVRQQVRVYLQKLEYHAQTFELFNLKGTPSHILVDKKGILRSCTFGSHPDLEKHVQNLLQESAIFANGVEIIRKFPSLQRLGNQEGEAQKRGDQERHAAADAQGLPRTN
ncbi:redoxin domain-containing protein [Methyloglobulus sp.]|uniref:peroxiredoxin family protein n=1 Tax=Methyloglobulus sp. TaxID=2518622 RepID=UPI0032B7DF4D